MCSLAHRAARCTSLSLEGGLSSPLARGTRTPAQSAHGRPVAVELVSLRVARAVPFSISLLLLRKPGGRGDRKTYMRLRQRRRVEVAPTGQAERAELVDVGCNCSETGLSAAWLALAGPALGARGERKSPATELWLLGFSVEAGGIEA